MSKLSKAWETLRIFGINPRDATDRTRARGIATAYLDADPDSVSDAENCIKALNVVDARCAQKGKTDDLGKSQKNQSRQTI
jgi:hypothetical protein